MGGAAWPYEDVGLEEHVARLDGPLHAVGPQPVDLVGREGGKGSGVLGRGGHGEAGGVSKGA
jgi:hypothetical protein